MRLKISTKLAKNRSKIGYPIFADLPTYLHPIISDFSKPTYLPNHRISYVDGPYAKLTYNFGRLHMKLSKYAQCYYSGELLDVTYFRGRSPNFSQTIQKNSYLIAQIPPSILCYNHKVASSTWMSTFAKLHGDKAYFQELKKTGSFYK